MDPLLRYLIIANVVSLVAVAVDYLLCRAFPALDHTKANSLVLCVFPIAGGAVGMLIGLFALGGIGRGHRMNKGNIAWWFVAIVCLIVWGLVAAVHFGLVTLDAGANRMLAGWDTSRLKALGIYLTAVNIVAFIVFAWDKHVASSGNDPRRRAPEARLLGISLIGGAVGGMAAMYALGHKTRKWYFVWGLPLFLVLDAVLVLYAHMSGIL